MRQVRRMYQVSILLPSVSANTEVNGLKEYIDSVKKAEREINRKEKALQAYLEGRKLTQHEIDIETSPEANLS
jgi:hypothetical protein